MDLKSASYCDAIYFMLCYYFCFDISYPAIYSEFLTAFQIYCLGEKTGADKKCINFRKFETDMMQYLTNLVTAT